MGTSRRIRPDTISIFHSPAGEARSLAAYQAVLARWPVPYAELDVPTRFGTTHLLASGPPGAPPLLLLHGQDSSATSWIYNIADLSQAFCTYAVDTIGDLGKSHPSRLPNRRQDYGAWLLDVFDHLKLDQADLLGLSYGGFLALNFALAAPSRVKHLVLLAPGIPNFGPPTWQWAWYGMPMLYLPSRLTVKRFIQGASTHGYSPEDPVQEQMIIGMRHLRKVQFMRPVFSDEELQQIGVPTLLLIGDHEIMYAPQHALARAAQLIPDLQTELIPNASHMLNSDQPTRVDERIVQFLTRKRAPS